MHHPLTLGRAGFARRAAALCAATAAAALALPAIGQASTVSNVGEYVPQESFTDFGPAQTATATYGETLTIPAGQTRLNSFTFYLEEPTSVVFRAYVYKWNGEEATGSPVYEGPTMHTTEYNEGQFQAVTVDTGGVSVEAGQEYVLFFSTSRDAAEDEGNSEWGGWAYLNNNNTFGHIVYLNAGYEPNEEWTTRTWEDNGSEESFEFSAVFAGTPVVSSVSPAEYVASGEQVTISGEDFTGAKEVLFGSTPATSFTVEGDSAIKALAPAGVSGSVDVRVVGPEGESAISSADRVTFATKPSTEVTTTSSATTTTATPPAATVRCVVPTMHGMSLSAVKAALLASHCALGTIAHHYNPMHKGDLTEQDYHQGTILTAGATIDIWLSSGHRPQKRSHKG